eukprot:s274_g20.t1
MLVQRCIPSKMATKAMKKRQTFWSLTLLLPTTSVSSTSTSTGSCVATAAPCDFRSAGGRWRRHFSWSWGRGMLHCTCVGMATSTFAEAKTEGREGRRNCALVSPSPWLCAMPTRSPRPMGFDSDLIPRIVEAGNSAVFQGINEDPPGSSAEVRRSTRAFAHPGAVTLCRCTDLCWERHQHLLHECPDGQDL